MPAAVELAPYDPSWRDAYARLAAEVRDAFGEVALAVHHVGSTAVPTVPWSKPVIDVLVEVGDIGAVDGAPAQAMVERGFDARGEYGIPGRRYFSRPAAPARLNAHVHVFVAGSPEALRHLAFRDFLRGHPAEAEAYSDLKRDLALRHADDKDAYQDGKAELVGRIEAEALRWAGSADPHDLSGILAFLREAERLKNVTRTAWTSGGTPESVAEHTWRLALMAVVLERWLPPVDMARLLEICIVHDLGEAIGGDVPAIHQPPEGKAEEERRDLLRLLGPLPDDVKADVTALWDEYEAGASREAKLAKALDKLETIMQHNQGANPPDFDYRFNLEYGRRYTADDPTIAEIRRVLDEETRRRAEEGA